MAAVSQKNGSATGMLVVKTGLMNEDAVSDIISERDTYVHVRYMPSAVRLSVVCRLSFVSL